MKNRKRSISGYLSLIIVPTIMICMISCTGGNEKKDNVSLEKDYISLFNGKNLEGWFVYLKDGAPADSTFKAENGILYCTGMPFGYIRTEAKYTNYDLTVKWRWPEEPGNSGVFLHVNDDKIFPTCLECQLMHEKAGDFVAFKGVEFKEYEDRSSMAIPKLTEDAEKPAGEWNTYDIHVRGDSVSIFVNGVLQNVATELNIDHGHIALQSEGAPVEFKDVMLKIIP